ncbi:MAG: DUF3800 domain-containing protein [Planctomycetes bacterium]|nr:DUF3800 domain-containing protein [Planctomycetota bacterium]
MYLLYTDASGTPQLSDVNSRHYVLVGLGMHEGTWFALNKRLNRLKGSYCETGRDFELHAAQFACSINEQNEDPNFGDLSWTDRRSAVTAIRVRKIAAETTPEGKRSRREKYKRTEPFIHLTRQERSRLLEDALHLVSGHTGIVLFGEAISKSHPGVTAATKDPVHQAFEQVLSRFDAFLKRKDDWKLGRAVNNGLLVLDHDYSTESAILNQFKNYRDSGHPWGKLEHVMDVPFFASSEKVCGLQLVDICAYAVRRYLDTGAKPGSHEERNFERIFHRFDRDAFGKLHGLRHYTPSGSCACLICQQRGHAIAVIPPAPVTTLPATAPPTSSH